MSDAASSFGAVSRAPSRRRSRFKLRPAWASLRIAGLSDPRYGQILAQLLLIAYGIHALGFQLSWEKTIAAAIAGLAAEYIGRSLQGGRFDPLSPLITAGSLTLLFRANDLWIFALAGFLAVASKFIFRLGGRHIFNPAALALFILPLWLSSAWVSPGQWGQIGQEAVLLAGLAVIVLTRAARLDTALAFLATWAALTFARSAYFGLPVEISLNQLSSGALFVFAFFMITDPATTPDRRSMRLLHAALVAGLGFWLQTAWVTDTGAIWALIFIAPLVGLMRILDQWRARRVGHKETSA